MVETGRGFCVAHQEAKKRSKQDRQQQRRDGRDEGPGNDCVALSGDERSCRLIRSAAHHLQQLIRRQRQMPAVKYALPEAKEWDGQEQLQGERKIVADLNCCLIETEKKRDHDAENSCGAEHGEASDADANGERNRQPGGGCAAAQDFEQMAGDRFGRQRIHGWLDAGARWMMCRGAM